jgi:hypothetical protein
VRNVLMRMARATRNFSARWATDVLDRLRKRGEAEGISKSRLAERYVDEGIRMDEHPGIEFRDGPAGRRAALQRGPDVWEVVMILRDYERHEGDAIATFAEHLNLAVSQVEAGVRYYAAFPEEIDDRINRNQDGWDEAEAAWYREHGAPREAAA